MYTKNLLSVTAAVALLSTGAMAFEAATDTFSNSRGYVRGAVVTENGTQLIKSSYVSAAGVPTNKASLSDDQKGDALIYPAFNQTTGWGTEIVVRNTSYDAVVAKAVIYAGDDSREVLDFNIYLSGKDVCRFTIKDGKISSSDGSIRTYGIYPHQVDQTTTSRDLTDYAAIEFGDTKAFNEDLSVETGYVVIYGMEQSSGFVTQGEAAGNSIPAFHLDHASLYAGYAATLDEARSNVYPFTKLPSDITTYQGWRRIVDTTSGAMKNGMFVKDEKIAPNIAADNVTVSWKKWVKNATTGVVSLSPRSATFGDVGQVLTGHVKISTEGRDMLLPATALNDFTDGTKGLARVLWTEGEYAALADRCLSNTVDIGDGTAGVVYDAGCVTDNATELMVSNAVYTFANKSGSLENQVLITQPYKRILAQLGNPVVWNIAGTDSFQYKGGKNWVRYIVGSTTATQDKVDTGLGYNFQSTASVWDEDEWQKEAAIGGTIITSPVTTGATAVTYNKELQALLPDAFDQHPGLEGAFDAKDGFADFNVNVPSIITQMVATQAGSSAEMNWIYSDTTK